MNGKAFFVGWVGAAPRGARWLGVVAVGAGLGLGCRSNTTNSFGDHGTGGSAGAETGGRSTGGEAAAGASTGGTGGTGGTVGTGSTGGAPTCSVDADCDDGEYCDGVEQCADGVCAPGEPVVCADDGDLCTLEVCDEDLDRCEAPLAPSTCIIDGVCVPDGTENPLARCQICDAERDAEAWTSRDAGTSCGPCQACDGSGACVPAARHEDCGPCQKCDAGSCVNQASGEDLKDECASDAGPCVADTCNGGGRCAHVTGKSTCGTCETCDGASDECVPMGQNAADPACGDCYRCDDAGACSVKVASCCALSEEPDLYWGYCGSAPDVAVPEGTTVTTSSTLRFNGSYAVGTIPYTCTAGQFVMGAASGYGGPWSEAPSFETTWSDNFDDRTASDTQCTDSCVLATGETALGGCSALTTTLVVPNGESATKVYTFPGGRHESTYTCIDGEMVAAGAWAAVTSCASCVAQDEWRFGTGESPQINSCTAATGLGCAVNDNTLLQSPAVCNGENQGAPRTFVPNGCDVLHVRKTKTTGTATRYRCSNGALTAVGNNGGADDNAEGSDTYTVENCPVGVLSGTVTLKENSCAL